MTREGLNSFGCKLGEDLLSKHFTHTSDKIQKVTDTMLIVHGVLMPRVQTKKATVKILDLAIGSDTLVDFKLKIGYPGQTYNGGVTANYEYQYMMDSVQNNYFEIVYHDVNKRVMAGQFSLHLVAYDTIYTSDTTFLVEPVDYLEATLGRFDFRY